MASVISHPAVALALAPWFRAGGVTPRVLLLGAACSMLPDADVVGFAFGIRYDDLLGHRGLTHSIAFAAVVAGALTATLFAGPAWAPARTAIFLYLFLCGASHGVLDAMTNGGLGVAFLAPFRSTRYFFPWRPIEVSPIGVREFLGGWGLAVLRSELVWIWLPSAVVGLLGLVGLALGRRGAP